jgi:Na+-transporting methylmalonyl-CoA/oxaloacetate decarboxylase gamma subunit
MQQIDFPNKITLFTIMGTHFCATPDVWLYGVKALGGGLITAVIFNRGSGVVSIITLGVVYALLILLTYVLHTVGHIISAREVNAPMAESVFTGRRQFNVYNDTTRPTPNVNMGRAIGGPLMNLTLATIVFAVWAITPGWGILVFALANLVYGVGSLLPIEGYDGAVLIRRGEV